MIDNNDFSGYYGFVNWFTKKKYQNESKLSLHLLFDLLRFYSRKGILIYASGVYWNEKIG